MKKTFTLLLILGLAQVVAAQPQITTDNMPKTGDHVIISICSDPVNPGAAGAMQVWDMSHLTESEEQSFIYINPIDAPRRDSFPDANLCAQSWQGDYSFYHIGSSGLMVEGHVVSIPPNDTAVVIFENREQIIPLPYTYNSTFFNEFDGVSYIPNVGSVDFEGSLDFIADGYGTLILPTGTYENVVRYYFYREQTNYVGGFPSTTQTKDQWAWVSADYRFWLLLMEENFDGFSTQPLIWYDKNPYPVEPSALKEASHTSFTVSPNPVRVGNPISVNASFAGWADIQLFSATGQMVSYQNIDLNTGYNKINLTAKHQGIYVLKIKANGITYHQKIVFN